MKRDDLNASNVRTRSREDTKPMSYLGMGKGMSLGMV